jgi:putative transposase
LLAADFSYVKLLTGTFAYVAFVIDAFAGTIIGWQAVTSKETRFVESDFLARSSRRTVHALARR